MNSEHDGAGTIRPESRVGVLSPLSVGLFALGVLMADADAMARPLYPHPATAVNDCSVDGDAVGLLATDLDNDGHLDLVAAIFDGSGISIMLGNGEGTFAPDRCSGAKVPSPLPSRTERSSEELFDTYRLQRGRDRHC